MENEVKDIQNDYKTTSVDWGGDLDFLNGEITLEEVQAVLQRQRAGVAPVEGRFVI